MSKKFFGCALLTILFVACKSRTEATNSSDVLVVNGYELAPEQFPLAGEMTRDRTIESLILNQIVEQVENQTFCSGSLICDDVVLTAAHCVHKGETLTEGFFEQVTEGQYFKTDWMRERIGYDGKLALAHPAFEEAMQKQIADRSVDVGLIKLKQRVKGFEKFNHFPLAEAPLNPHPEQKMDVYAVGYSNVMGQPSGSEGNPLTDMMAHHVKRAGVYEFARYSREKEDDPNIKMRHPALILKTKKQFICMGDSGGPVFVRRGSHWDLVGVVSAIGKLRPPKDLVEFILGPYHSRHHRVCEYSQEGYVASVPTMREWIVENARTMCSDPSQLKLDSLGVQTPAFVERQDNWERAFSFIAGEGKQTLQCTVNGTLYNVGRINIKGTLASLNLTYRIHDPAAYVPMTYTSPEYKFGRNELGDHWDAIRSARDLDVKSFKELFRKVSQKAANGAPKWLIQKCEIGISKK